MKTIQLTKGKVAQVDDGDYLTLSAHKWCVLKTKYGLWYAKRRKGKLTVYMHCEILGKKGVDHEDGNGLNNQRYNLREANSEQNNRNRNKFFTKKPATSLYKGVCKKGSKWVVQISVDKKPFHVGYFSTEIEAAKAYDAAAIEHYGKFAKLNFPEEKICEKV